MKKQLFLFVTLLFCASMVSGQFRFGGGAQFNIEASAFGLQGKAVYEINETIDATGAFTFFLDDVYSWELDLNAQYKGLDVSESFKLYPMAGLSMLRVSVLGIVGGTTTSLHIGASFRFPQDKFEIYAEPKFVFNGSSLVISGGVIF